MSLYLFFSNLLQGEIDYYGSKKRLGTDSVECVECLHHWLGSGIVAGVLTSMNIDGLIVIDD